MTDAPRDVLAARAVGDHYLVARHARAFEVARVMGVMPHLVVPEADLPRGYWLDEERRQIELRAVRRRLRRWWRRLRR